MPGGVTSLLSKIKRALHFTPVRQREVSQSHRGEQPPRVGRAVADAWGAAAVVPSNAGSAVIHLHGESSWRSQGDRVVQAEIGVPQALSPTLAELLPVTPRTATDDSAWTSRAGSGGSGGSLGGGDAAAVAGRADSVSTAEAHQPTDAASGSGGSARPRKLPPLAALPPALKKAEPGPPPPSPLPPGTVGYTDELVVEEYRQEKEAAAQSPVAVRAAVAPRGQERGQALHGGSRSPAVVAVHDALGAGRGRETQAEGLLVQDVGEPLAPARAWDGECPGGARGPRGGPAGPSRGAQARKPAQKRGIIGAEAAPSWGFSGPAVRTRIG